MLTPFELLGAWLSILLTVCILSFLYEDNPVYKLAEHIFLGVSIAIGIIEQWYGVFSPNLVEKLGAGQYVSLIPLTLIILFFFKLSRKLDWVARIPIAFIVAVYAGVKLTGEANANLMTPVAASMQDLGELYRTHGLFDLQADGAGLISGILLVAGLVATLLHFYFSAAHNRPLRVVSRFGVLILMLSFGASFGFTVMGRISLAIGRARELMGSGGTPERAAQVHPQLATLISLILVIIVLAVHKRRNADATQES